MADFCRYTIVTSINIAIAVTKAAFLVPLAPIGKSKKLKATNIGKKTITDNIGKSISYPNLIIKYVEIKLIPQSIKNA